MKRTMVEISLNVREIETIKLKAWKQGMTDAAEIADDYKYPHDVAEEIRLAADAKTEL